MGRLSEKVVLVTGATSGMGVDIARRCIEEGARVAISGRNQELGVAVAERLGEGAHFVPLDVTSEDSWQRGIEEVVYRFGSLEVLVNNAGFAQLGNVEQLELEALNKTYMTNTSGIFLGCKHAIAVMKEHGRESSLVNNLSATALKPGSMTTAYAASKAAALSLTKSIALHCAEQGYLIRCNAVLPGLVMTPMVSDTLLAGLSEAEADAALEQMIATHPIGRMLEGEEIANAVVYLASDESTGVTGTHIAVDGGSCIA